MYVINADYIKYIYPSGWQYFVAVFPYSPCDYDKIEMVLKGINRINFVHYYLMIITVSTKLLT